MGSYFFQVIPHTRFSRTILFVLLFQKRNWTVHIFSRPTPFFDGCSLRMAVMRILLFLNKNTRSQNCCRIMCPV